MSALRQREAAAFPHLFSGAFRSAVGRTWYLYRTRLIFAASLPCDWHRKLSHNLNIPSIVCLVVRGTKSVLGAIHEEEENNQVEQTPAALPTVRCFL